MSYDESKLSGQAPGSNPQPSCPAFLSKLWLLVGDEGTDELIHWSEEGNSFVVEDQVLFAQVLLPQFFKHNNMASFIRQLNMYGFRKKAHLDDGALKTERIDIEFQHPHFLRGEIKQLEKIKRKVSSKEYSNVKPTEVGKILHEVKEMKGKQDDITAKLESMKLENSALWREVVGLRQKHEKQQKIVNRLIHFLISLVQPKPKVGATRKRPMNQLMIEGFPDATVPSKAKFTRTHATSSALEGLPVRGLKQQDHNLDFLNRADSPTLTDIIDNATSQSKVTELFEGEELDDGDDLIPSTVPATATVQIPSSQGQVIVQAQPGRVTELPAQQTFITNQESLVSPATLDHIVTSPTSSAGLPESTPPSVNARPESVGSGPTSIPVLTALSPDVTYPLTPGEEDTGWLDMPPEDNPAEVVGLGAAGAAGLVSPTASEGSSAAVGQAGFGPGEGQLVLTSHSPNNENKSNESNQSRVIQRMLSNEEMKQDLGDQLSTVQSNLNDFKQLITTNPSLNFELGELLSDFQVFFDEPVPLTLPDQPSVSKNLPTGENGKKEDSASTSEIPTGNELVTYKPSTSYASLGSFMADDDDSLLRSLDDDSLALAEQKESDDVSFLL